jgi:oxygen-independent coproporphyrinogen-3 oxidase
MLDRGESLESIEKFIQNRYGASAAKASLLSEVAVNNRRFVPTPDMHETERRKVSLYLGIPYCSSRCVYCSFPSALLPVDEGQIACLLAAIGQDIQAVVKLLSTYGLKAESLYIGGGTPTCLPDKYFNQLMSLLHSAFDTSALKEFTVEAGRPDSITREKVDMIRLVGADRVSVNPQTMQQRTLDCIGRRHQAGQSLSALQIVRDAGLQLVNMDLIAGLPGENLADMQSTLTQVLAANPENITVHTLALKRGAELLNSLAATDLPAPAVVQSMVEEAALRIRSAGWTPYYLYRQKNSPGNMENVGYTRPGAECIYNIDMIEERRTIIGMGPSSATKAIYREEWRLDSCHFPKDIPTYIQRIGDLAAKRDLLIKSLFI